MFLGNIPILCFHTTSPAISHSPEWLARQLDVVEELGLQTISSRKLFEVVTKKSEPPKNAVALTFDDCHVSNWLYAAPMLRQRGMDGTFFAVTDFMWDGEKRATDTGPREVKTSDAFRLAYGQGDFSQFMNRAEVAGLVDDYGHEVYSHSCRHQPCFFQPQPTKGRKRRHWGCWALYGDEYPGWGGVPGHWPEFEIGSGYAYNGFWPVPGQEVRFSRRGEQERFSYCLRDFSRSMKAIRELNKSDLQLFCWPWGHFDPVSEKALKMAGFHGAFTLERGYVGPGTDPFRLCRLGIGTSRDADWLRKRLCMYRTRAGATIFFKRYKKKPETGPVLYATDATRPSGGVRQMLNNVRAMQRFGLEVHVVTPPDSAIREVLPPGVSWAGFDNFRKYFQLAAFFWNYARKNKISFVHTFHSKPVKAAAIARMLGMRAKAFFNRGVIFKPNPLIGLFSVMGDGIICNSVACGKVLRKYLAPKKRVNVAYNSFDGPVSHAPKPEGVNVVFVGNSQPFKGFDVFLKAVEGAWGMGADFEATAIGIVDMNRFADAASPETLSRVRSTGKLEHAEVLREMDKAHVLAIPSRMESMPNVLLEGFARALAPVVTRAGGMPEMVLDGENGYVVDIEDHRAMAGAIMKLASDTARARTMGEANRDMVEERLSNRAKGLTLLRIYFGEHVSREFKKDI